MRGTKMLGRALGVEGGVVEGVREAEEEGGFIVLVRPRAKDRSRCPICLERCPGYDDGSGRRRWRSHDMGMMRTELEADAPRIKCSEHGVLVAHVPWARHGSGFTSRFEDAVAWLAVRTDKTAVSNWLRIAWRTVGAILERVSETMRERRPPLEGVTRIGIDEVSYRKGHRYLTVVVDHDTGNLLWAAAGRNAKTLDKFFRSLGRKGRQAIQLISADAAGWIGHVVRRRCPNATLCIDPFHVVAWATKALDKVRRELWNKLRGQGETARAKAMKNSRWALMKNPEDLSRKQKSKLRSIEHDNRPLFQAYLMKEQLREVFKNKDWQGALMLTAWVDWVQKSRIKPMKKVARAIVANLAGIQSALIHGLSNARVESMNTKLRLLTRLSFGFHSHQPLIALAMLKLGGLCPELPRAS